MNRKSEFSTRKKVDYFGLMEQHKSKMKLQLIEESKNEIDRIEKTVRNIPETPAMIARKAEINAAKAELHVLMTTREPLFDMIKDTSITSKESIRRTELINCKRVLEAVVNIKSY